MKTRLTLLFLLILQITLAQGYRNHRFSLSYQPAYSFFNYLELDPMTPISHHKLNLGCALGKHFSVNLTGQHSFGGREATGNLGETILISDQLVGLQFNYFRKLHNSFTPIGTYWGVSFEYGMQNDTREEIVDIYTLIHIDDTNREPFAVISIHTGRNYLIKERLLLGFGLQFGLAVMNTEDQPQRYLGKPTFNIGFIF